MKFVCGRGNGNVKARSHQELFNLCDYVFFKLKYFLFFYFNMLISKIIFFILLI